MSWEREVEELRKRQALAREHGGAGRVARHKAAGKLPWCAVIVRKCYGIGGGAHANNSRYCARYAWPSASWGSMPIAGGLEASYRSELAAAADPQAKLGEIEERLRRLRSPFRTAEAFNFDEIIDPRETRRLLCEFAGVAAGALTAGPPAYGHRP